MQSCEEGRQQEERGEERQPQAEDDIFLAPEQHVGGVGHPAQEVAGEPGSLEEKEEEEEEDFRWKPTKKFLIWTQIKL